MSVGRARNAISKLMDLSPPMANVKLPDGRSKEVAPTEVEVGSIVVIRPGDKLPLDGKVVSGASSINQASITGESGLSKRSWATWSLRERSMVMDCSKCKRPN